MASTTAGQVGEICDLSKIIGFEWGEGNASKNEHHGVSMAEAEQVFFNTPLLLAIPKFASEAAERAFWEKNGSTGYLDWKKAQLSVLPNLKPSTQTISLRPPQHLLDSIKTASNTRDVPYQSLIKVWLQEKLRGS